MVAGTKRFVDPAPLLELDPATVRDRWPAGEARDLWAWARSTSRTSGSRRCGKTDDLRKAGPRAQRFHIGMTGSLTKALYLDSGGLDRTLRLGEDMELGHRLAEAGGVLVPDREARSWHLGRSQVLRRAEQVNRYNDPYLADLVPTMRPKRNRHGRAYQVPYLEVVARRRSRRRDDPAGRLAARRRRLDDLRVTVVGDFVVAVHDDRVQPLEDPVLETRWCTGPTSTSRGCGWSSTRRASDAEFVLTLPDVSLAPLPARSRPSSTTSSAPTTAPACCGTTRGAARLERTSALARVARLAGGRR